MTAIVVMTDLMLNSNQISMKAMNHFASTRRPDN